MVAAQTTPEGSSGTGAARPWMNRTHKSRFTLTKASYQYLRIDLRRHIISRERTFGDKAVRTMVDSDLRERRGRISRAVGPVFDLVTAKLLPPMVRPGNIRWSQLPGRADDGGARPIASVVQEQTRVLP